MLPYRVQYNESEYRVQSVAILAQDIMLKLRVSSSLFRFALSHGLQVVVADADGANGRAVDTHCGGCVVKISLVVMKIFVEVAVPFPLVHPGQQGEKFRKLLGSISWSSQVLSSRGRAALRELIFGFVVVYSLYTVVAGFCFVAIVLVMRLWQCYTGRYWRTSRACRWGSSMGGLWAGTCMRMRRARRAPEASAVAAFAPARARPLVSWILKKI